MLSIHELEQRESFTRVFVGFGDFFPFLFYFIFIMGYKYGRFWPFELADA